MFLQNKYSLWYNSIITRAKSQARTKKDGNYYESHHIIPKCMGGSNNKQNLVLLTAREHYICHWLLIHMNADINKRKMQKAFWCMCRKDKNQKRIITSRIYEIAKKHFTESNKGIKLSPRSDIIKLKISQSHAKNQKNKGKSPWNKGKKTKPLSKEHKNAISIKQKGISRRPRTEEEKIKTSNSLKGRPSPTRISCIIEGIHYTSMTKVSEKYSVSIPTVKNRILSVKYSDWIFNHGDT